jgi:hypothetical protein
MIPTVLFTERIKWRTDVKWELKSEWGRAAVAAF